WGMESPALAESSAAARFLASFLAFFSSRRSRSLRSRLSFAIVVFLLPVEAMRVPLELWSSKRVDAAHGRADGRPASGPPSPIDVRGSEHPDVRGRRALGALLRVVTHLRAVRERLEAAALDRV